MIHWLSSGCCSRFTFLKSEVQTFMITCRTSDRALCLCYSSQQDCWLSVSFILSQFSSAWLMSKWTWHYWTFTHSRNDRSASLFPLNKPRGSKVTVNPPPCSPVGDFRLHQQIEDDRQQVVGTHRLDTDCRGNAGNRQNNTCGPHTADTLPLSKPND